MSQFSFTGRPPSLKARDQWLVTKCKKPVTPSKGWQHSENQLSYSEARETAKEVGGELAFCFNESDPFVGFDFDDVRQGDDFTDEALEIVERLDSYTEVSASGNGLHVIAEGEKLADRKNRADLTEGHLEAYDESRYFILTGDVYGGRSSVEARHSVARDIQAEYLPLRRGAALSDGGAVVDSGDRAVTPTRCPSGGAANAAIVKATIERSAERGSKQAQHVLELWNRRTGRGDSHINFEFLGNLVFWCKDDPSLMRECFEASAQSWERHRSQKYRRADDWLDLSIHNARREHTGGIYEYDYVESN